MIIMKQDGNLLMIESDSLITFNKYCYDRHMASGNPDDVRIIYRDKFPSHVNPVDPCTEYYICIDREDGDVNLGVYTSEELAKKAMQGIFDAYASNGKYVMPQDDPDGV